MWKVETEAASGAVSSTVTSTTGELMGMAKGDKISHPGVAKGIANIASQFGNN